MLVLAGVSLNAIVGDNGIINNAQEAKFKNGMAAFEEWLQEEYVGYYNEVGDNDSKNKVAFLNKMYGYTLLLKDGTRDYIISDGKIYYLLNKNCSYIPEEIRANLLQGESTEYSKYTRLEDVYGITKDLKVYYCNNGTEGVLGNFENYDIDPTAPAASLPKGNNLSNELSSILKSQYGITVNSEKGLTLADVSVFKNLELNGQNEDGTTKGITDISGLGELKNLKTLTLTNFDLESLNGLEGIPDLYYLYLKNTTVGNYTKLADSINLKYLYIYMPSTMSETVANNQVVLLGEGLKNASGLTKLDHFGISRIRNDV